MLLLEVVEATFESLSATTMLELDEVNSATEPASSHRVPTMDAEGLPVACTPCSIPSDEIHKGVSPIELQKNSLRRSCVDMLLHATLPT